MSNIASPELLAKAKAMYCEGSDNNIEIDDGAQISVANEGTWVQAWVYVPNEKEAA
jgi:hypothetical protein